MSDIVEQALRDQLFFRIVSWWQESPEPAYRVEKEGLDAAEAAQYVLQRTQELQGEAGFLSCSTGKMGEAPQYAPPLTAEEAGDPV